MTRRSQVSIDARRAERNKKILEPIYRQGFEAGQLALGSALNSPEGLKLADGRICRVVVFDPPDNAPLPTELPPEVQPS